ncbi:GntR family transcriptional regulator [Paenisporosarcina sp. OV554]|uniref:GntR family transcriptional regulator n=1 Tax=Paenisporosarcina sp. OV554 TaxID=2135694 RepID=UPI000D34C578|nr:GntR family transcriptional regulator [Paenisporosarcina sp. OV554]PUB10453.1 DNA-binding GntR family transcriptional regulator [Paenisporosarcina sp. OV554]
MSIENKKNPPLYVAIYDKLFKLINEGVYPVGSKLPSEPELSKMMNVSRMTLRQALGFLKEDGYIETIHGQGNFIKQNMNVKSVGLEKIDNTVFQCCTETIDDIDAYVDVSFSDDYDYMKKIFNHDSAVMIRFKRVYKCKNKVVAQAFTMLPSETASRYQMNFNDLQSVLKILEEDIFTLIHSSRIEIKFTEAILPPLHHELRSNNNLFVLLIENLCDSMGNVVLKNKIYIPIELSSIKINRINKLP